MESVDFQKLAGLLVYQEKAPLMFNSGTFLALFLFFYATYLALKDRQRARIGYAFLFSLFFYYKTSGWHLLILIFSTLVNYRLGRQIHATRVRKKRLAWLWLSVAVNLGVLGYFKYANFIIDNVNAVMGGQWDHLEILLPVGISFYTFQTMSYTIDVYRRETRPAKSLIDFGFFVSFFPQLVAGPIVRARDFLPQIRKKLALTAAQRGHAFVLIMTGLFKKVVISDYLSVNFVDRVFANPDLYSGIENLLAVYAYAMQIYCDFSGYSDMAIGLSLLMGFHIPLNFNMPYRASSITEFWRRWHLSLSTWLRDYLYIPLGGNRSQWIRQVLPSWLGLSPERLKAMSTYANLMITMLLGGLWHGASWKFMIWGGCHGLALALEKRFGWWKQEAFTRRQKIIAGLVTFHVVCLSWIYFRADSATTANLMLARIVGAPKFSLLPDLIASYWPVLLVMAWGYATHFLPERLETRLVERFKSAAPAAQAAVLAGLMWVVIQVASSEIQPFIYFQF